MVLGNVIKDPEIFGLKQCEGVMKIVPRRDIFFKREEQVAVSNRKIIMHWIHNSSFLSIN